MSRAVIAGAVAALLFSCSKTEPLASRDAAATSDAALDAGRSLSPLATFARDAARAASSEVKAAIDPQCHASAAFFALRHAVAKGKPLWRVSAPSGSEVLLGPLRPVSEGGGALGGLDVALAAGDCAKARAVVFQVDASLRLIAIEIEDAGVPEKQAARALSDAALELGSVIVESTAEVGTTEEGVVADAFGLLDGIDEMAALFGTGDALNAVRGRSAALREKLKNVSPSRGPSGRALFALETGYLGAELRALVATRGYSVAPPFPPRVPVTKSLGAEPISVLTVPAPKINVEEARVVLGRRLFADRRLSVGGRRACATCHDPARAFTDGARAPRSLDPSAPILRNTPTLLYAAAQAAMLWDGRVITTDTQALRVIHSAAEMGLTTEQLETQVKSDASYRTDFARAFPDGVTAANVARALGAFEDADLVPANAPIDRFARGERGALSAKALAGFDVFTGVARCSRCHVPPLFGGTRPADFAVTIYAALGVTTGPDGKSLDADRGRAAVTGQASDERAFKTPALREIARTAPYFHHGGFPTLEGVVDFYAKGGGRGFGHAVPTQDPDVRPITWEAGERDALLEFLRVALSETKH